MGTPLRQRLLPPSLFMISVALMVALHFLWPGTMLRWQAPYHVLAFALLGGGLALTIASSRHFARRGTNINTFGEPGQLVTDGLFRYTRNPMYLGFTMALLGVAKLLGSASPWLVVILFTWITDRWYIAFEETSMKNKFGSAYLQYQKHTRRWL